MACLRASVSALAGSRGGGSHCLATSNHPACAATACSPSQDLPLYTGGVSSGASFALKLINELAKGEVDGVFSEVLAVDPEKDPDFDVSF